MKKLRFIIPFFAALLFFSAESSAQVLDPSEAPLDGVYSKSKNNANRKPIPYVKLREADVMWLKRTWRIVDMEEKMNQVFYYPKKPTQGRKNFVQIIMDAIMEEGSIQPYAASVDGEENDMFQIPMTPEEVAEVFIYKSTFSDIDEQGNSFDKEVENEIPLSEITKFKIKEEVFFDNERSVLEFRILGIAPIVPKIDATSEVEGYQPEFWIYFPEARFVFAQNEVFNRQNDVHRITYDDLFWKRMFASRIVKESNTYDRKLEDYLSPMDALLEAEEIERTIFNFEHDLWSF